MNLIQDPFRTHNLALLPLYPTRSHPDRNSQRLERALRPVVVILAPDHVDVQGDGGALREALQAMRQHLAAQVAQLLPPEAEVDDGEGPVGQVDDGAREGLVERGVGVAEAREARRAAERGLEGVAERDEAVFGAVVVVDCGISAQLIRVADTHRWDP